jgi:hypothetical protein
MHFFSLILVVPVVVPVVIVVPVVDVVVFLFLFSSSFSTPTAIQLQCVHFLNPAASRELPIFDFNEHRAMRECEALRWAGK